MTGERERGINEFINILRNEPECNLGKHLGDVNLGFRGDCYEFAVAVKRFLGRGEYHAIYYGSNVDHVMVKIDGEYMDAGSIRKLSDILENPPTRNPFLPNAKPVVKPIDNEFVENIADEPRVKHVLELLRSLGCLKLDS